MCVKDIAKDRWNVFWDTVYNDRQLTSARENVSYIASDHLSITRDAVVVVNAYEKGILCIFAIKQLLHFCRHELGRTPDFQLFVVILLAPGEGVRSRPIAVFVSVCLSVGLSARMSQSTRPNSSSHDNAISCVLPVLWTTSCFLYT